MPLEVRDRTTNILSIRWSLPQGVSELFTRLGYPHSPSLKLADLVIFIDGVAVAYSKISENTPALIFDVNVNSVRTQFTVEAIIFKHMSNFFTSTYADEIENEMKNKFPTREELANYILYHEDLFVNLTSQNLSCEVNSKSAKIQTDFLWTREIREGLGVATASEILETWRALKPFYWDDQLLLSIVFEEELIGSEDFSMQLPFHDNLFTDCDCVKHHGDWTGVQRQDEPKCQLEAPTVTPMGATASTTYMYVVVPNLQGGAVRGSPSGIGRTVIGPAALSGVNYNRIEWEEVTGAFSYDIYRVFEGDVIAYLGTVTEIGPLQFDDDGSFLVPQTVASGQNPDSSFGITGTYAFSVDIQIGGVSKCVKSGTFTVS